MPHPYIDIEHVQNINKTYYCILMLAAKLLHMCILAILCKHYMLNRWHTYSRLVLQIENHFAWFLCIDLHSLHMGFLQMGTRQDQGIPFSSVAVNTKSICDHAKRCFNSGDTIHQGIFDHWAGKWWYGQHSRPWQPSGHDSIGQYLSSLQMPSTSQANPSLVNISTHPSHGSCKLIFDGSDKLSKVYCSDL